MSFKKVKLEDKSVIDSYLKKVKYRNCDLTFANIFLWSKYYETEFTIIDDMLVFKTDKKNPTFFYPIGNKNCKDVLDKVMDYCNDKNIDFKLNIFDVSNFEEIEKMYPNKFNVSYDRDNFDYVYKSEDLINLSGKKYHGKKNHINKFKKNDDWQYEAITKDNIEECYLMANEWYAQNYDIEDKSKIAEIKVTKKSLMLFDELGLEGGLIRLNKKIVAFTIGEAICDDTFVVHIEKAFSDVQGAYPMINQQFILHSAKNYTYINREEDMGIEGLRKAKLSYNPVMFVEKGIVTYKNKDAKSECIMNSQKNCS